MLSKFLFWWLHLDIGARVLQLRARTHELTCDEIDIVWHSTQLGARPSLRFLIKRRDKPLEQHGETARSELLSAAIVLHARSSHEARRLGAALHRSYLAEWKAAVTSVSGLVNRAIVDCQSCRFIYSTCIYITAWFVSSRDLVDA